MQMTGYELLANYEKAEDKDKQIQILADLTTFRLTWCVL